MHTRVLKPRHGPTLLVRPLDHGDVQTVMAVFEQFCDASRRARFNGAKPCLSRSDLRELAAEDDLHHALVGYIEGNPIPVAIARLVRDGRDSAEIAFAVADAHQHKGIGSALTAELLGDARAAGIRQITALTSSDNHAALALLRRTAKVLDIRFEGTDLSVRAAIA